MVRTADNGMLDAHNILMFAFAADAVSQAVSYCAKVVNAADVEESIKSGGLAAIKTERIKVQLPHIRTVHQDSLGCVSSCVRPCVDMH